MDSCVTKNKQGYGVAHGSRSSPHVTLFFARLEVAQGGSLGRSRVVGIGPRGGWALTARAGAGHCGGGEQLANDFGGKRVRVGPSHGNS